MIISKNILAISKILVVNDPFASNFVAIKRSEGNLIAYATNGFVGIKVTFPEFNGEDYPYIDSSYSIEKGEIPIAIEKDACMQLMKMAKKSSIPILNNTILIDEKSFDSEKERINAVCTDLENINKATVKCKDGTSEIEAIEYFLSNCTDSEDSCKEVGFNPFYMSEILLIMAEVLGITKKNPWSVTWVQPIDKFHPIFLAGEKDSVEIEAFVMPRVDNN